MGAKTPRAHRVPKSLNRGRQVLKLHPEEDLGALSSFSMASSPNEAGKRGKSHILKISPGLRPGPRFRPFPSSFLDLAAHESMPPAYHRSTTPSRGLLLFVALLVQKIQDLVQTIEPPRRPRPRPKKRAGAGTVQAPFSIVCTNSSNPLKQRG